MNYEGYLICTDVDGTFLPTGKNINAIKSFQQQGGRFTVATGRNISYIEEFFSPLEIKPNAAAIMCNGSVIYDYETNSVVKEHFLKKEDYSLFCDIAQKFDVKIRFAQRGASPEKESIFAFNEKTEELLDMKHMYKAVWWTEHKMEQLEKYLYNNLADNYEISKSCGVLIEANPKGISKSSGTLFVKDYTKCHTLICVGDYENDISMLKTADISYAVENARQDVKEIALRVTVKNTEDAIAKIISDITTKI